LLSFVFFRRVPDFKVRLTHRPGPYPGQTNPVIFSPSRAEAKFFPAPHAGYEPITQAVEIPNHFEWICGVDFEINKDQPAAIWLAHNNDIVYVYDEYKKPDLSLCLLRKTTV
jgi:hypothetical protein